MVTRFVNYKLTRVVEKSPHCLIGMSWLDLNLSLEKSARRAETLSLLGKYSYSSIRACAFSHLLAIAFVAWALISIRASDVTPWALKEMMPSDNFSLWPASRPLSLTRFCNLLRIWVFSRLVKKRRVGWLMFLRDRVWRLLCFFCPCLDCSQSLLLTFSAWFLVLNFWP